MLFMLFGGGGCSDSGSLAQETALFVAVTGFRAVLIFRYESPMGWLARLCQANRLKSSVFVSAAQRHSCEYDSMMLIYDRIAQTRQ